MKLQIRFYLALILAFNPSFAESAELRTFTNTQGKAIEARLINAAGGQATIEMTDRKRFTLAISTLSTVDQDYIKKSASTAGPTKASPNDNLTPETVNEIVGQPLFAEAIIWSESDSEIAQRLKIPPESKTKTSSSYRSYTKDDYKMFGAHPYSLALHAENDKVTSFSIVFANKGDLFSSKGSGAMHFDKDTPPVEAATIVKKAMDQDLATISTTISKLLGKPQKERFGEKAGRMNMQRWDWRGHAILLAEAEGEYIGLQIVTTAFADAGGKVAGTADAIIRARALANLEKRPNSDVVIGDIPMVDQGPKGYCAPATAERAMRYLGIPADMYILANAGQSGFGGGTNVSLLLEGMADQIRSKRRSFDSWQGPLKLKELAKYIDKGVPVMWLLYSTKEFNELANKRTEDRRSVSDWASWRGKIANEAISNSLPKDLERGHVALIIGYNKDTNEFAFSDSWGERFKERWITFQEAEKISAGQFYVVGF